MAPTESIATAATTEGSEFTQALWTRSCQWRNFAAAVATAIVTVITTFTATAIVAEAVW